MPWRAVGGDGGAAAVAWETATGGRGQPICCADLQVLQAAAWNAQREA